MPTTRFSVIIVFYNHEPFVRAAVDSILEQRDDRLEVIAVDDGSTDGTKEALVEYGDSIQPVFLDPNEGASAARNAGASRATGDYLVFLDGDDVFMPWAIDVYETVAREKQPVLMIGSMSWFRGGVPESGTRPREIFLIEYRDYFSKDRAVGASASAMVIERKAFQQTGGWQDFPVDDHDLLWKLGTAGRVVQIVHPPTTFHRSHAQQTSLQTARVIDGIEVLIRKERQNHYPGGRERRFERRACVGGVVFHWSRLALRRGLYRKGLAFLLSNSALVMAAAAVRFRALFSGRREPQRVDLATRGGGSATSTVPRCFGCN
jgi:GT2 family glycosyltransferase